jgi:arginine decarboxylase
MSPESASSPNHLHRQPVDYDGTRSANSESSVNYSIQEYVNDSISIMVDASNKNNIPHPNIITESGRSLTAHHSVLIFEVLETASLPSMDEDFEVSADDHELVQELYQIWDNLNQSPTTHQIKIQ